MRQRQPDSAKLKKPGCSRVKDPARNVDVRNGVTIKKDGALMVIENQSANRKCGRNCGEQQIVTARSGVIRSLLLLFQRLAPNYPITKWRLRALSIFPI